MLDKMLSIWIAGIGVSGWIGCGLGIASIIILYMTYDMNKDISRVHKELGELYGKVHALKSEKLQLLEDIGKLKNMQRKELNKLQDTKPAGESSNAAFMDLVHVTENTIKGAYEDITLPTGYNGDLQKLRPKIILIPEAWMSKLRRLPQNVIEKLDLPERLQDVTLVPVRGTSFIGNGMVIDTYRVSMCGEVDTIGEYIRYTGYTVKCNTSQIGYCFCPTDCFISFTNMCRWDLNNIICTYADMFKSGDLDKLEPHIIAMDIMLTLLQKYRCPMLHDKKEVLDFIDPNHVFAWEWN